MTVRLALAILPITVACAHPTNPKLTAYAEDGDCEAALTQLEQHPPRRVTLKNAVGWPLSYVATGLGYVTDVVIVVSAGAIVGIGLCAPFIALEVATNSNGAASAECFDAATEIALHDTRWWGLPGVGNAANQATQGWRCADLTPLSEQIREVAACYADRGDLTRARQQLDALTLDPRVQRCISERERDLLDAQRAALATE